MDTVTFVTPDKKIQFTVKKDYVNRVNVETTNTLAHFAEHKIMEFMHNPAGPAMVQFGLAETHKDRYHYYLNGKPLDGEEKEQFIRQLNFNTSVDKIVNED